MTVSIFEINREAIITHRGSLPCVISSSVVWAREPVRRGCPMKSNEQPGEESQHVITLVIRRKLYLSCVDPRWNTGRASIRWWWWWTDSVMEVLGRLLWYLIEDICARSMWSERALSHIETPTDHWRDLSSANSLRYDRRSSANLDKTSTEVVLSRLRTVLTWILSSKHFWLLRESRYLIVKI